MSHHAGPECYRGLSGFLVSRTPSSEALEPAMDLKYGSATLPRDMECSSRVDSKVHPKHARSPSKLPFTWTLGCLVLLKIFVYATARI